MTGRPPSLATAVGPINVVSRYIERVILAHPPPAHWRCSPPPARAGRRRCGLGAGPPHRAVHQPLPVPPVGVELPTSPTSTARAAGRRGRRGRRRGRQPAGPLGAGDPRPRHPRGDGGGAGRARAGSPRARPIAKPLSAAVAIGTGGPFGAEGPIIVTGGALGSLLGQVAARVGERAQDPARLRRRRRHGGDVRRAARRGRAGHRAAAVRVLDARVRPARRGDRASPAPCTPPRSAPGPLFDVPAHDFAGLGQLPWFAAARHRVRPAGHADRQGPVRRRARLPPAARRRDRGTRSSAPWPGRRSGCSCRARSASATTSSTTSSPAASPSATLAALADRQARHLVAGAGVGHVRRHAGADPASSARAPAALVGELLHHVVPSVSATVVRPRRHGGHVRRRDPGAVRGDRVRVRADPRLRRHPPADAGHGARRDRVAGRRCATA